MSVNERPENGGPIASGSPLARALDDFGVPALPADFADRVIAAAEARPAPLPELRRRPRSVRGWRTGQRIAIGLASFGALATAAAATGLLERLDIPVPSAERVWASITGKAPAPAVAAPVALSSPAATPAAFAPVEIVGPIDTPEELGEAFRRIDEVRQGRRAMRRELVDERIAREIERRRAAGLPLPTAEEEARLRQRIEAAQTRREQFVDERIELRREEMARRVESGEALTREDVLTPLREDAATLKRRERIERLRTMPPEERRRAFQALPPAERRALVEEWRQRRARQPAATAPLADPVADAPPPSGPVPAAGPSAAPGK